MFQANHQSEARNLALMADRMDDSQSHSPVGGLTIWVALASFFSNSQDRGRARDALKKARDAERLKQEEEGEEKGTGSGSGRRFGSWFKSSPRKPKSKSKLQEKDETVGAGEM